MSDENVSHEIGLIHISAKCSDMFCMTVEDVDGNEILDYDGYVPDAIPNDYGDYVTLVIDAKTGVIKNWRSIEKINSSIESLIEKDRIENGN